MNSPTLRKDDLSCDICYKLFDCKVRTPRVLLCGHTFCQSCLEHILTGINNGVCPSCRKNIATTSVNEIAINHFILSIVSNIEKKNTEQKSSTTEDFDKLNLEKDSIKKKDKMPPVGQCEEHSSPVNFKCFDCFRYICGACAFLFHKTCNRVLPIDEAVDVIKDEGLKKLVAVKEKYFDIYETLSRRESEIRQMNSIQEVDKSMEELDLLLEKLNASFEERDKQLVSIDYLLEWLLRN